MYVKHTAAHHCDRAASDRQPPPHVYFVVSAVFHYLGPSFAVLLFARVQVLGVAWLRIASAAVVFAIWRRPWRTLRELDPSTQRLLIAWGAVLAVMNCCFYEAIAPAAARHGRGDRVPAGDRARRARRAHRRATRSRWRSPSPACTLLSHVQLTAAAARARVRVRQRGAVRASTSCSRTAVARHPAVNGIDGLGAAMLIAAVVVTPLGRLAGRRRDRRPAGAARRRRRRHLLVGDPVRHRSARDGPSEPRDVLADGLAAARDRDRDRRDRAGAAARPRRSLRGSRW